MCASLLAVIFITTDTSIPPTSLHYVKRTYSRVSHALFALIASCSSRLWSRLPSLVPVSLFHSRFYHSLCHWLACHLPLFMTPAASPCATSSSCTSSSSAAFCQRPCAASEESPDQPNLVVPMSFSRDNCCGAVVHEGCTEKKESSSTALCKRGCPLINGVCPISDAEWRQAQLEKETASSSNRGGEKQTPAQLNTNYQERRKWQQRAIILYVHTHIW